MAGDREKLKRTVVELQTELADVDSLDPEIAQRLQTALADVQSALERPETATPVAPAIKPASSLGERLAESALRIEESHPALSTAIGNFAGILGQMGF